MKSSNEMISFGPHPSNEAAVRSSSSGVDYHHRHRRPASFVKGAPVIADHHHHPGAAAAAGMQNGGVTTIGRRRYIHHQCGKGGGGGGRGKDSNKADHRHSCDGERVPSGYRQGSSSRGGGGGGLMQQQKMTEMSQAPGRRPRQISKAMLPLTAESRVACKQPQEGSRPHITSKNASDQAAGSSSCCSEPNRIAGGRRRYIIYSSDSTTTTTTSQVDATATAATSSCSNRRRQPGHEGTATATDGGFGPPNGKGSRAVPSHHQKMRQQTKEAVFTDECITSSSPVVIGRQHVVHEMPSRVISSSSGSIDASAAVDSVITTTKLPLGHFGTTIVGSPPPPPPPPPQQQRCQPMPNNYNKKWNNNPTTTTTTTTTTRQSPPAVKYADDWAAKAEACCMHPMMPGCGLSTMNTTCSSISAFSNSALGNSLGYYDTTAWPMVGDTVTISTPTTTNSTPTNLTSFGDVTPTTTDTVNSQLEDLCVADTPSSSHSSVTAVLADACTGPAAVAELSPGTVESISLNEAEDLITIDRKTMGTVNSAVGSLDEEFRISASCCIMCGKNVSRGSKEESRCCCCCEEGLARVRVLPAATAATASASVVEALRRKGAVGGGEIVGGSLQLFAVLHSVIVSLYDDGIRPSLNDTWHRLSERLLPSSSLCPGKEELLRFCTELPQVFNVVVKSAKGNSGGCDEDPKIQRQQRQQQQRYLKKTGSITTTTTTTASAVPPPAAAAAAEEAEIYLRATPDPVLGWADPKSTTDPFSADEWRAFLVVVSELLRADKCQRQRREGTLLQYQYKGGRYGMATELQQQCDRFRHMRLGDLCHLVQLAIDRGVLAYEKSVLQPVAACVDRSRAFLRIKRPWPVAVSSAKQRGGNNCCGNQTTTSSPHQKGGRAGDRGSRCCVQQPSGNDLAVVGATTTAAVLEPLTDIVHARNLIMAIVDQKPSGCELAEIARSLQQKFGVALHPSALGFNKMVDIFLSPEVTAALRVFAHVKTPHKLIAQSRRYREPEKTVQVKTQVKVPVSLPDCVWSEPTEQQSGDITLRCLIDPSYPFHLLAP